MNTGISSLVANLYNPHEQSRDALIRSFVVRTTLFDELFQDIKSSQQNAPGRHYLIQGQRGMGKTTLLLRLNYAIEQDRTLRTWLIPIVFKEEAYYGIRHLSKLWETIAQELEVRDADFSGLLAHIKEAHPGASIASASLADYEQTCFDMVTQALNQHQQHVILFIDNLGEMLQNFTQDELLRLRDVLTRYPYFKIAGATSCLFEAFQKGNIARIFYETFAIVNLKGLQKHETHSLLLELGKAARQEQAIHDILEHNPGRVEALRILTGGVIRTLVLLFEIFTDSRNGNSLNDLNTILDRVTPLYQSRMQDLTPMQREVVNAIALHWDAVSPEEIAREAFMSDDEIHTVLRELEYALIVQHLTTENQQHLYRLNERFFNIWYLMRLAPGGSRNKVVWLLHFLESWYDKAELNQQARKHTQAIQAGQYAPHFAYYLAEALAKTGQLDTDTETRMLRQTRALLQKFDTGLADELSLSDKDLFSRAEACYREGDYKHAIKLLLTIKHKQAAMYFRLGECFIKLASHAKAIQCFAKAAEKGHIESMLQLALLYRDTVKDLQQAVVYYQAAIKKGDLSAMLSLGHLYSHQLHDYRNAEKYYVMTVKEGRKRSMLLRSGKFSLNLVKSFLGASRKEKEDRSASDQGVTRQYFGMIKQISTDAMYALGNLYANHVNDPQKAQQYYIAAIKAGNTDAILQLGFLYHYTLKDYKSAIKYYLLALKRGGGIEAATNLGVLYHNDLRDYKHAEKYYKLAAQQDDAGAMNGLGWLYFEHKVKKEHSLKYARRAAEKETNIYTMHTLACIYLWNNQPEQAIETARAFMFDQQAYTNLKQDILLYLMLLLAKRHYEPFADYLGAPGLNLREQYKPLYFAYLYTIRDQNYYRRPPELIEPIKGIISKITRLALDYA